MSEVTMVTSFLFNGISRVVQVYGTYSPILMGLYSYFSPKVTETKRLGDQLKNVAYDVSTIKGGVDALHGVLSDVCVSCDEIIDIVKEKKKREKDKERLLFVENVGNVLIAIIKSKEKFKSGDPLQITRGVLDIISSAGSLIFKGYSPAIGILFGVIGAILTEIKPQRDQQPSVVDQLAKVVHDELIRFNKRLQDQINNGLKRRVSDQQSQLQTMKPGEKLDDPNLWNDFVQFMGELSNRFESPLPFKCKANLTSDPDVADFVSAVVTYCEAYCCFMALLIAVKGKFAELGSTYKEVEDSVDRKIICQMKDARKKLSFLSEERFLTFLGRLPYEGGKLTKIVVLSRITRSKSVVEAVRRSLGLTPMQNLDTIEEAATKVARQSVKGKVEGHHVLSREAPVGPPLGFTHMQDLYLGEEAATKEARQSVKGEVEKHRFLLGKALVKPFFGLSHMQDLHLGEEAATKVARQSVKGKVEEHRIFSEKEAMVLLRHHTTAQQNDQWYVQFINETPLPIKIVSGRVGSNISNLEFVEDVQPHASYRHPCGQSFSTAGYIILYLDGKLPNPDTEQPVENTRVIEFALSYWHINIQDKTNDGFENGMHFMARSEIVPLGPRFVWRFVVQSFDPCSEQDLITIT